MTHQSVFIGLSSLVSELWSQEKKEKAMSDTERQEPCLEVIIKKNLPMCQFAVAKTDSFLVGAEGQELLVPKGLERRLVERDDGLVVRCRDRQLRVVDHFGLDVDECWRRVLYKFVFSRMR